MKKGVWEGQGIGEKHAASRDVFKKELQLSLAENDVGKR